MLSYLQKVGRSLMVPISVLPAAALLMGIGYWIDPTGWGTNSQIAAVLINSGSALIDNLGILFAIGIAFGMSKDQNGTAAVTGLVGWLIVQKLLSPATLALVMATDVESIAVAFTKVNSPFIGILIGIISAEIYNRTYKTQLTPALSFFSGRRLAAIVNSVVMLGLTVILIFVWPVVYSGLVTFGESMIGLGAVGAGLFGFFNRLLIPVGLHHALNSVFWFDVAGINDIPNFLSGVGTPGVTGMYQAGFFPIMMFGLPAAAFAMYQQALPSQKAKAKGILLAGAIAAIFTGVTEPLEFLFMFTAPGLYLVHAILTGISMFIAAQMQWMAGFGFSAGLVDFILSTKNPLAVKNYMLIVQGIVFAGIYYGVFTFAIKKWNIKTIGRTEGELDDDQADDSKSSEKYLAKAQRILDIVGIENLQEVNNCTTRLRLTVTDSHVYAEEDFKKLGIVGVVRPAQNSLQLIVGPDVEFVAEAMKTLVK